MIQSYINVDGQLVSANYGDGKSEDFLLDGLALVKRGGEQYINEPHVGNAPQKLCFGGKPRAKRSARRARKGPRGNPVVSSTGTSYFNDMLGTTVGAKTKGKYSAAVLTAFGEDLSADTKGESSTHSTFSTLNSQFFTGKPHVAGLGHAFLFRNYRAGLAKWQTGDPLGYPDGWNSLTYCKNGVTSAVDLWGCEWVLVNSWDTGLSDPKWKEVSSTGPSAEERWNIMTNFGISAWLRPYEIKGSERVDDPEIVSDEIMTENMWYKNTTVTYRYTRVDTLGMQVTTKELKDDPSLLNAVATLAFTFGSKIKGPAGVIIGLASDVLSVAQAVTEISEYINQYGVDTMWDVEFGTKTFEKERQRSWGFLYIKE